MSKTIKSAIRTCPIRNDFMSHKRDIREVICRDYCMPCLRVIELGKCERLREEEQE